MTPAELPDSLRILGGLRHLDEAGFIRLMMARRVNARGIGDLLDLAEVLVAPDRIRAALYALDWPTLLGLRTANADALERASALMLAAPDGSDITLLPEVDRQVRALIPDVPDFTAAADSDPRLGVDAAHELATVAGDALEQLDAAPRAVRTTRSGVRMSGVDVRRIAVDLALEPAVAAALYRWLIAAECMAPADDRWVPTIRGREFRRLSVAARWRLLAQAWCDELDACSVAELADTIGMPDLVVVDNFDDSSPATTTALRLPADVDDRRNAAVALGVLHEQRLTVAGAQLLADHSDAAANTLDEQFPAEIDQVYVQPDRTVIAPGPLTPEAEHELRGIAQLQRRAIASEYLITESSIARALATGKQPDDLRATLKRLSLTGIPQPVDYLIGSVAARFGTVRVRGTATGACIRTTDANTADMLRVDASLRSLNLQPADDEFVTAVAPAAVLATLLESRYPAVLEDAAGNLAPLEPQLVAEPYVPTPTATVAKVAADLAELAATSECGDDRVTWLLRQLELARRAKQPLDLTIDIGNDESRTLLVIPIAVSPQRLRVLDLHADVERTVPLRAIVAATHADADD